MSAPTPDPDAVPVSSPGQCCRVGYCIEVDGGEVHELTREQADRVVDMLARRSPRPAAVSEEAVDAVARARYERYDSHFGMPGGMTWEQYKADDPDAAQQLYLAEARWDLTAALPHLAAGQSEAEVRLAAVKQALANHPDPCGKHPDDDGITCGWKAAVIDVHAALARTASAEDGAE